MVIIIAEHLYQQWCVTTFTCFHFTGVIETPQDINQLDKHRYTILCRGKISWSPFFINLKKKIIQETKFSQLLIFTTRPLTVSLEFARYSPKQILKIVTNEKML